MGDSVQYIEQLVLLLADQVPLELFVFVGALLEEIIAPIPSMLVMTTAGLLARLESHTPLFLLWLVLIGNIGKVLGSLGWYVVGDKVEDVFTERFSKYFGITHRDIDRVRERLTGAPMRDGAFIFLLRVIPIFPSLAVSLACGILKIPLRTFMIGAYLGSSCKDFFYIMFGYFGLAVIKQYLLEVERVRVGFSILIILTLAGLLVLAYRKRHHGLHLLSRMSEWVKGKLNI